MSAKAEAKRRWREQNPDGYAKELLATRALSRALRRLGRLHPVDLSRLVDEERQKLGLDPVGDSPLGRPRKRDAS